MLPLKNYPVACQHAVRAYGRAISLWSGAAGLDRDDVLHAVVVATLEGDDPGRAVPAALGLRRLGARWVALDPVAHPYVDVAELAEELPVEVVEGPESGTGLGIGGMADIAKRLGVTPRRAQQLAAAQRQRVAACGDLFLGDA